MEEDGQASSESGSLELATSSDNGLDDEEEEESSTEEIRPPSIRELPQRSTRGQRLTGLVNADEDVQFWEHETWREEADDDEWETDDEGRYRDKFDSDFLSTESEDEDTEAGLIDKAIESREYKKFDYQKIALRRQQRKEACKRVWSSFDIETEYNKDPSQFKRKRPLFQSDHLRIAKETEKVNERILVQLTDELETKKYRQGQQHIDTQRLNGEVENWVSWNSDRKIEYEESKKSENQKKIESTQPLYSRQLLFFVNLSSPQDSSIPPMYNQPTPTHPSTHQCSVFPHLKAKYQDPVTLKWYSGTEAFNAIRQRAFKEELEQVSNVLQKTLESNMSGFNVKTQQP
eukprot:Protomagalhaensia_wolfi_Nauph_80__2242@NODE_245_length_3065_cov_244_892597_g183_i0_p2_GENE_NODE_245_length_3065_cov_244_892597_g183_i0NODE_245_length_3065_cov_244_892597_g183_i0_p2_ORF_typecomplete_len390_score81_78YL1/PF05764_13/2_5e02YL1/PF05764_13/2_6e10YL1/PF05764_13/1_8e03YL1_C/PF08265_11/4_8e03YL1_C/PF08265_11/0_055DUF5341/PF17276_2/29DUF5341/PF17276_2/1_2_NODE_245_length_3065_cov_244_892597_g183_i01341171